ncbi:hypothetical protein NQ315_015789, partial [Exocentrus adspersus]
TVNYITEQDVREPVTYSGNCTMGMSKCKGETACKPLHNFTYTCLCTHDSLPPTARGTCPRRIVNQVPGVIPNVQPPSNKFDSATQAVVNSTSSENPAGASTEFLQWKNYLIPSTFIAVLTIVIIYILFMFLRKRSKRHNAVASPINLKHSLLVAERYAPNPQYSACSGTGIPLLRKETLKFLNEIGEGCFGKVFKGELLCEDTDQIEIVAIKVLKDSATREAEENFLREVEIMSAFRHPNILSLLGVVLREITIGVGNKNKSLPRPPPLPVLAQSDILDAHGYLMPKEVKEPAQYLQTMPD